MKYTMISIILAVMFLFMQGFKFKKPKFISEEVDIQKDFRGAKVSKKDLAQGCPKKDCIPALQSPKFVPKNEVNWLLPEDTVFVLEFKKTIKIYPQKILNWHELVNDEVDGIPILISFCPLSGTAIAFERIVNNTKTRFGVSGKLYNSDLVMYDKLEGNLWQQVTGEAIVGPAARRNEHLVAFPLTTTTWEELSKESKKGYVLSINTGFKRNYEEHPYGDYETNDNIHFPVKNIDQSIPPKTPVIGIIYKNQARAYKLSDLEKTDRIIERVGPLYIRLIRKPNGKIEVVNQGTLEKINAFRYFWFTWKAFYPESTLYEPK